jgi:hypothetical protein
MFHHERDLRRQSISVSVGHGSERWLGRLKVDAVCDLSDDAVWALNGLFRSLADSARRLTCDRTNLAKPAAFEKWSGM